MTEAEVVSSDVEEFVERAFERGHDADSRPGDAPSPEVDMKPFRREKRRRPRPQTDYIAQPELLSPSRPTTGAGEQEKNDTEKRKYTSEDLEKGTSGGTSSAVSDKEEDGAKNKFVVDWEGPDDPANPMNWKGRRRAIIVALISFNTLLTPLASTIFAPGVPQLMRDFHSHNVELESFVVSVYILGFVFGPLVEAPLSELYGRVPVTHVSNLGYIIFTIACGLSTDLPMFIIFRFMQGVFGCTPLTIGGGVIADIVPAERRGATMAVWALGPLMGPVIGPVAGGYLTQAAGWHWIFWLVAIVSGVITIASVPLMHETYAPVLLERKAKKLRKTTGDNRYKSVLDDGDSPSELFRKSIIRPTKMLFLSPIIFMLSLDMSIVYGYLYLLFTTFSFVFEYQYNFSTGSVGLVYLGTGIGSFIGLGIVGYMSDRILKKKTAANGGVSKPEFRLGPLVPGAILMPIGLFWYGWTAQEHVHWIVPIIGTSFVGIGLLMTFMPIQTYLVDAYERYAASATATCAVMRSLFGAVLPLAGQSMYRALGLGWGNSLLAFIALALIPVPFFFLRYGERIRTSPRFQLNL